VTGLPAWLSLNVSTGVISGTSPYLSNNSTRSGPITVKVTDSVGAVVTLSPFYWFNTDMAWNLPSTVETYRGQNMSGFNASDFVNGGTVTKVYVDTNIPTGLSVSSTGAVTGSTYTRGVWDVTLAVTDSVGATVSTTIRWTVS
jgi:hypothetical protein